MVRKKLAKKYPAVCFEPTKANYIIVWSSEFKPYSASIPVYHQSTTTISGDVNATATTGWYDTQAYSYKTNNVYMFIYPANRKEGDPPIFATHKETWWTYRAAHRQALDEALQFLAQTPAP